jgi:hypothetical protein
MGPLPKPDKKLGRIGFGGEALPLLGAILISIVALSPLGLPGAPSQEDRAPAIAPESAAGRVPGTNATVSSPLPSAEARLVNGTIEPAEPSGD